MNHMVSEVSDTPAHATRTAATAQRLKFFRRTVSALSCAAIGVIVGWIAFQLEQTGKLPRFLFPLLFPLFVGAIAGALSVPAARLLGTMNRRWPSVLALFAGVVVVSTQAWCSYRTYADEIRSAFDRSPQAALFRAADERLGPASFSKYLLTQIRRTDGWWIGDAVLTMAASVAMALVLFPKNGGQVAPLNDS